MRAKSKGTRYICMNETKGVTADVVAIDQLGIDDKSVLRLLKLGMFDVASTAISKMAGDDPRFEGCDLAGINLDIEAARAACGKRSASTPAGRAIAG